MKSICTIFLFAFAINIGLSQTSESIIDSLETKSSRIKGDTAYIETLMHYVWSHARIDRNVSFYFLDKVENYRDSTGVLHKGEKMLYYRGVLNKNARNFKESEKNFKDFQNLKIASKDTQWMGACHNVLLNLYVDMELYEKATEEAEAAIKLYQISNDTVGIVRVGSRIGSLLTQFGNTEKGMKYIRDAYELGRNIKDYDTYAYVINDMGYGNEMLGQVDSAIYYYQKFAEFSIKHKFRYNEIYAKFNLATAHLKNKDFETALKECKLAVAAADKYEESGFQSSSRFLMGEILAELERYDEAFKYIKDANKDNLELRDKMSMNEVYYNYYRKNNNSKLALFHHEKWKLYTDSLNNLDVTKAINDVEAKYETAKKDREIETLALRDELNKSKISGRNRWIGFLGFGLVALGFLLFRIFSQNKLIMAKKNDLSIALKDKNVLLKEIHHRVKNNLQVISSLLGLQSRYVTDSAALEALNIGKSRVQSMSLLHQKLYSNDDLKSVNVKNYFEELIENLVDTFQLEDNKVVFETNIDDINLDIDTVVPLGLVTNELISNALKHAFKDKENGLINLKISDDGVGIPFTEIPRRTKSLGLQLIRSFTQKLDGNLIISNENGTSFSLEFKQ